MAWISFICFEFKIITILNRKNHKYDHNFKFVIRYFILFLFLLSNPTKLHMCLIDLFQNASIARRASQSRAKDEYIGGKIPQHVLSDYKNLCIFQIFDQSLQTTRSLF